MVWEPRAYASASERHSAQEAGEQLAQWIRRSKRVRGVWDYQRDAGFRVADYLTGRSVIPPSDQDIQITRELLLVNKLGSDRDRAAIDRRGARRRV
jgi:hypothetical protein